MNSNDYVKYLIEQFTQYINQPRMKRQSLRQAKTKSSVHYHLFGMIPYAFSYYLKKLKQIKIRYRRMYK